MKLEAIGREELYGHSRIDALVDSVAGDPAYLKFLLAEYPYIMSALEARGQCFDEEWRIDAYSASIGNNLHLDVIDLVEWLKQQSPYDVHALQQWAYGETVGRPAYLTRRLFRKAQNRHAASSS